MKLRILEKRGKKCKRCGCNKYEILQLHHKDKNKLNNKLDNLESIYPNCHYGKYYLEKNWLKDKIK